MNAAEKIGVLIFIIALTESKSPYISLQGWKVMRFWYFVGALLFSFGFLLGA